MKTDPTAVVVAEGIWIYAVESPQGGEGVLTIKNTDGKLSGTVVNNRNKREVELTTVVLTITYEVNFGGNSAQVIIKGVIADNKLDGTMSFGQFGSVPLKATRK